MTYNVFGGTLSLTQSINQSIELCTRGRRIHLIIIIVNHNVGVKCPGMRQDRCPRRFEDGVTKTRFRF